MRYVPAQRPTTWRELLKYSIQEPHKKQRVATALGMNQLTLSRWIHSQSKPRYKSLHLLLNALPELRDILLELIVTEFPDFVDTEDMLDEDEPRDIPSPFYDRMFQMYSDLPVKRRYRAMCEEILKEAISQLDPQRLGMEITIAVCGRLSYENRIRYLREDVGIGTSPWSMYIDQKSLFLGKESLAGYSVSQGHNNVAQDLVDDVLWLPIHSLPGEASSAVYLIRKLDMIAGCLIVSSSQLHYFSPASLRLIENYASLLTLAFNPVDFYPVSSIEMGIMPAYEVQQEYRSLFRSRVDNMLKDAQLNNEPIHILEAERIVWEQLADEMLRLSEENEM